MEISHFLNENNESYDTFSIDKLNETLQKLNAQQNVVFLIFQHAEQSPKQSGIKHFPQIMNYMTHFYTSKSFYASFNIR